MEGLILEGAYYTVRKLRYKIDRVSLQLEGE